MFYVKIHYFPLNSEINRYGPMTKATRRTKTFDCEIKVIIDILDEIKPEYVQ